MIPRDFSTPFSPAAFRENIQKSNPGTPSFPRLESQTPPKPHRVLFFLCQIGKILLSIFAHKCKKIFKIHISE